ncbi:PqiC family protein, partial [Candidatus Binatus sp.]
MTLTSFFRIFLAGVIAASMTGCSYMARQVLAPQKDVSKFYLLTPTADTAAPAQAAAATSGNFTLGLGPIKLPPYLDRPEVVTRAAPNRLELSKEDRWGESIQNGFTSAIERDLAAQAGATVIVFPWYNTVHIDMQVQIDVYRFETDANGTATLSAKWTILDSTGKNILYTVESNLTQPSKPGDMTEAAAALSRTIGDL